MTVLTAILTHLDARSIEEQLAYLGEIAPSSRFVVCHGGKRADFDALPAGEAVFIEDRSLRGPHFDKSLNETLGVIYDGFVRSDPTVELVYIIEYDHLIVRGDFEDRLTELAADSDAGLFGKRASARNDTNWSHFLRFRDDDRLNRFIARITRRDDPTARWGCLGTGMLFRRDALGAFCETPNVPPMYVELFVPTLVHHLGFGVVDIDARSGIYTAVRWVPEFSIEETLAATRAGHTFVHPFKRLDELRRLR
jgi:hypothetical protein